MPAGGQPERMDTNEKPVVVAAGPEDLIAAAWFNLGYRPRDSLVVLGLEGPRRRLGVLLRADLPRSGTPDPDCGDVRPLDLLSPGEQQAIVPRMVRDLLGTVAAGGAAAVLAIVADEQALSRRPPAVFRALRHEARALGLHLVDVLGVTSTAFGSLKCRDPRCCPPGGRPISLVLSSRTAAVHVVNGETVAESEAALLADVTPEPASSTDQPPDMFPSPDSPSSADWSGWSKGWPTDRSSVEKRSTWWPRWVRACAEAAEIPSRGRPLRGFSAALHDSYLRDAVLLDLLDASPEEVGAMLDGTFDGPPHNVVRPADDRFGERRPDPGRCGTPDPRRFAAAHPERLGSVEQGFCEPDLGRLLLQSPQDDRLRPGRTVLAAAVRVAAEGDRAPALAVLAMIAWFEGRGGRARLLVERASADAASVSLTRLVEDLLLRRVPPPWLRPGPLG
jgi:hypothetical protein